MTSQSTIDSITKKIASQFQPQKIVLFGSYAWGEPTADSDIDLFVIQESDKNQLDRARAIRKELFGFGTPTDLMVLTPSEVEKRLSQNDLFVKHILDKGKILYEQS